MLGVLHAELTQLKVWCFCRGWGEARLGFHVVAEVFTRWGSSVATPISKSAQ
jgi:hypothetical protein